MISAKKIVMFLFILILLISAFPLQSYAMLGVGDETGIEYYEDSASLTDENGNIISADDKGWSDTVFTVILPVAAVVLALFTGTGLFLYFRRKKKNGKLEGKIASSDDSKSD